MTEAEAMEILTPTAPRGVTYFLRLLRWEGSFDNAPIKIGRSTNFEQRYASISQSHCEFIEVLRVVPDSITEREVHKQFKKLRLRSDREWFSPGPDLLKAIELLAPFDTGADRTLHYERRGSRAESWTPTSRTCLVCKRAVMFWRRPKNTHSRFSQVGCTNKMGFDPSLAEAICPICRNPAGWLVEGEGAYLLRKHQEKLQLGAEARGMPLIEYIQQLELEILEKTPYVDLKPFLTTDSTLPPLDLGQPGPHWRYLDSPKSIMEP